MLVPGLAERAFLWLLDVWTPPDVAIGGTTRQWLTESLVTWAAPALICGAIALRRGWLGRTPV